MVGLHQTNLLVYTVCILVCQNDPCIQKIKPLWPRLANLLYRAFLRGIMVVLPFSEMAQGQIGLGIEIYLEFWKNFPTRTFLGQLKGVAKKIIQILLPTAAFWFNFSHFWFIWQNADTKSFPISYRRFLWDIWVQIYINFTEKLHFAKSSNL